MADLEGFGEKGNRISIGVSHEATETGIRQQAILKPNRFKRYAQFKALFVNTGFSCSKVSEVPKVKVDGVRLSYCVI